MYNKKSNKKTPSFSCKFNLKIELWQEHKLNKIFETSRKLYNSYISFLYKNYNCLLSDKEYQTYLKQIKKLYNEINKNNHKINENKKNKILVKQLKENNKRLKENIKSIYKDNINLLYEKHRLTLDDLIEQVKIERKKYIYSQKEYMLRSDTKSKKSEYIIDSVVAKEIANNTFDSFKSFKYSKGKKMHYKKYDSLNSIKGQNNKVSIRCIKDNINLKNGNAINCNYGFIQYNNIHLPLSIKKNDLFRKDCLEGYRIKYCILVRKIIKGKVKFFVQIIFEGIPPRKRHNKDSSFKHIITKGKVGLDNGVSTMAIVSKEKVLFQELVPNLEKFEDEKRLIQRKMDRSQRKNNSNNYNPNGTIKRGKKKWNNSNNYKKLKLKLKELYRLQCEYKKREHNKLANEILSMGNEIYTEHINYKVLQKRSKLSKDGKGRYKSRKMYGRSILNRAPAMFLEILEKKSITSGGSVNYINKNKVKASQYNHLTDKYIKKELNERWNTFNYNNKEIKVQRDLYSAYLIYHVLVDEEKKLDTIDKIGCKDDFDKFLKVHDAEIERLKKLNTLERIEKLPSCMGI